MINVICSVDPLSLSQERSYDAFKHAVLIRCADNLCEGLCKKTASPKICRQNSFIPHISESQAIRRGYDDGEGWKVCGTLCIVCSCVMYLCFVSVYVRTVMCQPFVQDKSPSSCDRMTKILHVCMKRRLKGPRMDLLLGGSCE